MDISADTHNFFEIQKREHQEMVGFVSEIHLALATRPADVKSLQEQLRRFCEHVEDHFEAEEQQGYLHEVIERGGILQGKAEALQNEHASLRLKLHELRSILDAPGPHDESWVERVKPSFDGSCNALLKHEAKEDDLIHEAQALAKQSVDEDNPSYKPR